VVVDGSIDMSREVILAVYENLAARQPIEYTIQTIFSSFGLHPPTISLRELQSGSPDLTQALVVSYGHEMPALKAGGQIHIHASDFFGEDYLKPCSMPATPLRRYNGLPVIYPGRGALDGSVQRSENLIETNIDIVASSFFMLSRYEEVILSSEDRHGRFPATASLAHREGFLHRPIVNEYIELLWTWIHLLRPDLERKPAWPAGKEFAVCLTHDIDSLKRYSVVPPVSAIRSALLQQRKPRLALDMALDHCKTMLGLKKDPYDTFGYILDSERSHGFTSSFYFMAGGGSKFDDCYSLTSPRAAKLIDEIEREGHEVGLHGSYHSCCDRGRIASEKRYLDNVARCKNYGCRQHYLRWKTPDTWRIQQEAGLLYDTTLSFAERVGFRCGTCLPFRPFDALENQILDIWELPMSVMERSLQHPDYQALTPEQAYSQITQSIETVRQFGGVFVLLWHNSSFDPLVGWDGWREVYERAMLYISEQNALVVSGREIVKAWSARLPLPHHTAD
jgi:peptidoglycan/xylan/chitin deacetylase (PgdA/CDA1 family)